MIQQDLIGEARWQTARVLFVDDDADILHGLARGLHRLQPHWTLEFACGTNGALERLAAGGIDAVVSDIAMPGRDGFALLQSIRQDAQFADIPVVLLTGREHRAGKRRALDLGASDLLTKPADLHELVARVQSVLRLKACQESLREQNALLEQRVCERTSALEWSRRDLVWRLAQAAELRDADTGGHLQRVAEYCRIIGSRLGLDGEAADTLALASLLHDIGKIGIPDTILRKPGPLTAEERATMQTHCFHGARILSQDLRLREPSGPSGIGTPRNQLLETATTIALCHHERWDGGGYPQGLKAEQIPAEARIVAIADVFDALCSRRPYKEPLPEAKALEIMTRERGHHFAPCCFDAFLEAVPDLRLIQAQYPAQDGLPGAEVT